MITTYLVDQNSGPFKTIQEALNQAQEGSFIKIRPGIYIENLIIKTANLTIMPKQDNQDVTIISQNNPTILIDLKQNEMCTIIGLKLSQTENIEDQLKQNLTSRLQKIIQKQYQDQNNLISQYNIYENMSCVVYIKSGICKISQTFITLNYIIKDQKDLICGIVAQEETKLILSEIELKGNQTKDTIGIISICAHIDIETSLIHRFSLGGALILSGIKNNVQIKLCRFKLNGIVGLNLIGPEGKPLILENQFESNMNLGILVSIANNARIMRNTIVKNEIGIKSVSANPQIQYNQICENKIDGIQTLVFEDYIQKGLIKYNLIVGNKGNGISCDGYNNHTEIRNNKFIGLNHQSGIKLGQGSKIVIYDNHIAQNYHQGILMMESAQAFIEQNLIENNIKANIVLGGKPDSQNTFIVNNKIYGSMNEGIFMTNNGQVWILRNEIYKNNDGIVIQKSNAIIENNQIYENQSNGIFIQENSQPEIFNNHIYNNDGIGIFIRDKSQGNIYKNKVIKNEIDCVCEKYSQKKIQLNLNNNIQGEFQCPKQNTCVIF